MSNTKHTPGPWSIFRDGDNLIIETIPLNRFSAIAEITGGRGLEEDEANARLIAAAPELLEALEQILTRFTEKECKDTWDKKAVWNAKLAIQKATNP